MQNSLKIAPQIQFRHSWRALRSSIHCFLLFSEFTDIGPVFQLIPAFGGVNRLFTGPDFQ